MELDIKITEPIVRGEGGGGKEMGGRDRGGRRTGRDERQRGQGGISGDRESER